MSIAGLKAGGQPLVVRQAHEVIDAVRARDGDRVVGGAVVDDQPLHAIEALDLARQVGERLRELIGLVEAGNLNDELHQRLFRCVTELAFASIPERAAAPGVRAPGAAASRNRSANTRG